MIDSRRDNNFDLLRLLAALQVAVLHAAGHLEVPMAESTKAVLRLFPGVPIFFTISGYLIFQSYQRNSTDLRKYALNRVLRIYPGIGAAYVLGLALILLFAPQVNTRDLALWSIGQLTIFQYWTPGSLRSYGVGTPNGALWTIPVELQFYALLPFIYRLWRRYGPTALAVPFAVSVASYLALFVIYDSEAIPYKLFMVSVLPYLFNFLIGVALAAYPHRLNPLLHGKGVYWLIGYTAIGLLNLFSLHLWVSGYNPTSILGMLSLVTLSVTVISLAYTAPRLSITLLRGNDISYGIYIYHMPIVNAMVQRGYMRTYGYLPVALVLTTMLAIASWRWLESYFLRMKVGRRSTERAPSSADVQW